MNILVIGSGGREHALVWKIAQSKKVRKIYCAPGNPGTSQIAQNIPIEVDQLGKLVKFAKDRRINLTIVGPEIPLIAGIVEVFEKNKLPIIGPNKKAAQIEGSKVFAKKLMLKYKIPTADFAVFDDFPLAQKYLKSQKYPLVLKADGQCAGKGVTVCSNEKDAQIFLTSLMKDKVFGLSGNKVIIEECLIGSEVSFMVATDGEDFVTLLPSQDHKRVFDGDLGPNTGGMGAYAPVPFVGEKLVKRIEDEIIGPTIDVMRHEGCPYTGILYPGLILTKEGPKVLEYNCRFGDPETQPLMMMLKSDIVDLFKAIIENRIDKLKLQWHKGSAVCVVLTAKGYPGKSETDKVIYGLTEPFARSHLANSVVTFHTGTKIDGSTLVTVGGRVMGITARDKNLKSAIKKVYSHIGKKGVHFSGMHYRKDIGKKGLLRK